KYDAPLKSCLRIRLWELLIVIMKAIFETLGIIIEDIDLAIAKVINQNGRTGILELFSPESQCNFYLIYMRNLSI
ncbi:MAG: hypothetical protein ACRDFB_05520, partial [Rhabdochlamydiaceae bacterium]